MESNAGDNQLGDTINYETPWKQIIIAVLFTALLDSLRTDSDDVNVAMLLGRLSSLRGIFKYFEIYTLLL